jgi:hypothetical protein
MNPLIQLKKVTPLFVIALVLACFTLSPQAFAAQVAKPTFAPYYSACHRWELRISTTTTGAIIYVWGVGTAGITIANNGTIPLTLVGPYTIWARAYKVHMTRSDLAHTTYKYPGPCH